MPRGSHSLETNSENNVIERAREVEFLNDPKVNLQDANFAFFTTRILSVAVFGLIVLWACGMLLWRPTSMTWLEMAFLVTAWFWMLSPTQNPWYWVWSLPLLVFARGRMWFFLSGTLLAYYLRFWFEYQFTGIDVMGYWNEKHGESFWQDIIFPYSSEFAYQGTRFFDLYIPILEFGPWMVLLLVGACLHWFLRTGTK